MKIKTIIHVHFVKYSWEAQGHFEAMSYQIKDDTNYSYVGPQEIEVDVPDHFDPRPAQSAVLEAQKQKVMADFQKSVTDINRRISELSALEQTA
jgi:hypothetical protein